MSEDIKKENDKKENNDLTKNKIPFVKFMPIAAYCCCYICCIVYSLYWFICKQTKH